jgi:quaternary ammonium compound-resistance protein SugE
MIAWIYLVIAGLLEVAWAICLKQSDGFSRLLPSVGFVVFGILSLWLLARALRTLPVGTAYAIWTGIGAAGTAVLGIVVLGESRDFPKLLSLVVLLAGIVGLKLTGEH